MCIYLNVLQRKIVHILKNVVSQLYNISTKDYKLKQEKERNSVRKNYESVTIYF